jgi:circadian clock protein KaiB
VTSADPQRAIAIELYVQGQSAQSNAALAVVTRVCEAHLSGRYRLEVIDINQFPERTRAAGIAAAPALVRRRPEPIVRRVGRLSEARVRAALGLEGADGG